jgi:propanediol dehydratase small subunit
MAFDPSSDYPLGANRPDLVRTPGGIALDELQLHGDGVETAELRATPETLRLQAEVARAAGRVRRPHGFAEVAICFLVRDSLYLVK